MKMGERETHVPWRRSGSGLFLKLVPALGVLRTLSVGLMPLSASVAWKKTATFNNFFKNRGR